MKGFGCIVGTGLLFAGAFSHAGTAGAYLLNGNRISGTYIAQQGGDSIFDVPWVEKNISIPSRYVGAVAFDPGQDVSRAPGCLITMTSGDWISGDLIEMTDEHVVLKTAWSDRLHIQKQMLTSVDIRPKTSEPGFSGLGSLSQWSVSESKPSRFDPQRISSGPEGFHILAPVSISRTLSAPKGPFLLEIRFQKDEGFPHFNATLSNLASGKGKVHNHLFLISERTIYYRLNHKNQGHSLDTWRVRNPEGAIFSKGPNRVMIGVDPQKGQFKFWINGELLKEWSLEAGSPGKPAKGSLHLDLSFTRMSESFHLKSLNVTEWIKGEIPVQMAADSKDHSNTFQGVMLRNGDLLHSQRIHYEDEVFSIHPENGAPLRLARERVAHLVFPSGKQLRPLRRARDVVVTSAGGRSRFIAELLGMSDGVFTLRHDAFTQELSIPVNSLNAVRFNPYTRHRFDDDGFKDRSSSRFFE